MSRNRKLIKGKGTIALSQIFLLLISTVAFSYFLASSLPLVSGQVGGQCVNAGGQTWRIGVDKVTSTSTKQVFLMTDFCSANGIGGKAGVCTSSPFGIRTDARVTCPSGEIPGVGVNAGQMAVNTLTTNIGTAYASNATSTYPVGEDKKPGFFSYLSPSAGAGTGWKYWAGYIASNAAIAFGIKQLTSWGLQLIKVDKKTADSIGWWAGGGYFAGAIATKLGWSALSWLTPLTGFGIGFGIGLLWALFSWKDVRYYQVTFSCMPWDAPKGGDYCDLCNNEDIPCTEYRCMSLGTHCEYLEEEQLCFFNRRIDTNPPVIEPWKEVLTEGYQYSPDNAISPPDRGVKIVPEKEGKECIEPFTPLTLGVTLDKPARCKIDNSRPGSFEDMKWWMDGGLHYNHSYIIPSVPSAGALKAENMTLREGGEFSVYIRCETRQGYSNPADFVFSFCVDDGPDMGEPVITRTSIVNNSPVSYFDEGEEREVDLTIYTNEPAECRWSRLEQAYEDMPAENQINCPASLSVMDTTNLGDYKCESTTLTGLKNRENNDYYISCIDQPHLEGTEDESLRNVMEVPYLFRLIGTQPLILDSAEPNNTIIRDSTQVIKVMLEAKTSAGYDRGAATCYFSPSGEDRFVEFYETGTHEHKQRLDLAAGDYSYDIRCVDLGGNAATTTITFTVETDTTAPTIVRAFREGEYLKIITDENSTCVYSNPLTIGCRYDFEDGTEMKRDIVGYGTSHSLPWDSDKTFYIKCEDEFKNRPAPDKCSIIARPYEN